MEVKDISDDKKNELLRYARLSFASLQSSILQDLINNKNESVIYKKYTKDKVISILENPQRNEKDVRELSNFLYIVSSNYRRLVDYFSSILLYNYTVIPTKFPDKPNKKKFNENYTFVVNECEKYNLQHESTKILKVAVREGVFYGLCFESDDSFYIKQVQSKYAQISGIEDGCFVFKFDLNFFNSNKELLPMYGKEFESAYKKYKGNPERGTKGDKTLRWYEPKNGICIKADESDPYFSLPIFTGLVTSIYDIDDYKMLQKAKTENDNYKAIGLKLATDDDGVPKLDFDQNEKYFNHIVDNISNSGIGVFMSPFELKDFSFATNKTSDTNEVINAEAEFWQSAGVSSLIFGSAKATSSSSLTLSVKPDEQLAFSMLMQIQRFFNKKFKKLNMEYGFKIEFLNQSIFNNDEFTNRYFKAAQYGVPAKTMYWASLGLSPSDMNGLSYLEDDILGLGKKKWITPLVSSNTQSSISEGTGRPTNDSKGENLTESGEQTKENDENDNK